ncbi:MAG: class II glutamine amidotransferase [Myxococcota bacterium]
MCRFILYHGPEIPLADLITRPRNSLINQSFDAEWREEPLNGDGFGMAWYVPSMRAEPAVFRSITPAWSNPNLLDLAAVIRSGSILAHVRAASPGLPVMEMNCHPFRAGKLAFMHNGFIPDFKPVRRRILERISAEAFDIIDGTTDSEHVFALFVDQYRKRPSLGPALRATLREIAEIAGPERTSLLNLAVSDGTNAAVCRATIGPDQSASNSLFVHAGMQYLCDGTECRMIDPSGQGTATIVSSEPLSDDPGWMEVPQNHLVVLEQGELTVESL